MSQDTNLQVINVEDDFDQRVQDYFTNYFELPFKLKHKSTSLDKENTKHSD